MPSHVDNQASDGSVVSDDSDYESESESSDEARRDEILALRREQERLRKRALLNVLRRKAGRDPLLDSKSVITC